MLASPSSATRRVNWFPFPLRNCKPLIQNFFKKQTCSSVEWEIEKGFGVFINPPDLEEEQNSSVKLSGEIFSLLTVFIKCCVCVFLIMRQSCFVLQQSTIMSPVVSRSCVYRWGTRCTYLRNWKVSEPERATGPDTSLFSLSKASWHRNLSEMLN